MLEAVKRKAAVAIIQEPYIGNSKAMTQPNGVRVYQNARPEDGVVKSAIVVFDPKLEVSQSQELTTNNIVVVNIRSGAWKVTLASFYFEPDQPLETYLEQLKKIERVMGPKRLILGGDANSKNVWWGGKQTDHRGEDVMGIIDELGLQILNRGNTPTFSVIRGGKPYTSFVDLTVCSEDMLELVDDWQVVEDLTGSDHNGMKFKIKLSKTIENQTKPTTRKYNTKKADWGQFHEKLTQIMQDKQINKERIEAIDNTEKLDHMVNEYSETVNIACTHSIPIKKYNSKYTIPWWSKELDELKAEVATMKRRIPRAAPIRKNKVVAEYLEKKEKYEKAANEAQINSWKEFCEKQDRESVWEGIYRIMNRTSKRAEDLPMEVNGKTLNAYESTKLLANTFYPQDDTSKDSEHHKRVRESIEDKGGKISDEGDPPFTLHELKKATMSFNPKKAPGSDGFTADICQKAINSDPDLFLAILNKCLKLSHFPQI
ncbi:hypothetical protein O0L34_g10038 [Tuta absoluta]|nr:hypothetical protein O0L34_g10038 [Tuta absoluta]